MARLSVIAIGLAFLLTACNNGNGEKTPDVSNIKIHLQTYRFDMDLYALDTNNIAPGLRQLEAKYPDFLNYFLDTLMAYGIHGNYSDTTTGIREGLKTFLTYKGFKRLEDTIKTYYPDSRETDAALQEGFTFMKYYYPEAPTPKIIYLNMGLSNWATFPPDINTLCIGLDMFLGDQFPYYGSIGVPSYMGTHLRKSYIPVSAFTTLYRSVHPLQQDDRTLLDLMIQRGKEQYFLHKLLPHTPDSVLFGYAQAQVEWCNENEALIYNFFIQRNLLYSKEAHTIHPYVFDGPNTPGIPGSAKIKTTPGNLGTWLGYKIVCAYMAQHPQMTLKGLTEQKTDAAKFLDEARYRPK